MKPASNVLYVSRSLYLLLNSCLTCSLCIVNPCWIFFCVFQSLPDWHIPFNPCRIYIYAWNSCQIRYIMLSMYFSVDIFLVRNTPTKILKCPMKFACIAKAIQHFWRVNSKICTVNFWMNSKSKFCTWIVLLAYGYHFPTSVDELIKIQGSLHDFKVTYKKKRGTFQGIFRSMNSVFEI